MDYNSAALTYRVRKALRYCRLYGPRRTWAKIRAEYHMNKRYQKLPPVEELRGGGAVGIIGCGKFAYSTLAYFLKRRFGSVFRGVMDIDIHRAASFFKAYDARYYTDNAELIISDPEIRLVCIASKHSTHAEYAIRTLDAGKSVYIEKPHVVDWDQLARLCQAARGSAGKVFLGFNRPKSRLTREAKTFLATQSGPQMLNWFVWGHEITPGHWYHEEKEGGSVLGNLCHWLEIIYHMVPPENRFPTMIQPMRRDEFENDVVVTLVFGDGSVGVITFCRRGDPFEGLREIFTGHRGSVLVTIRDFKSLTVENGAKKRTISQIFRDHGHRACIEESYQKTLDASASGASVPYIWETACLFLKTKEALESGNTQIVNGFHQSCLGGGIADASSGVM